MRIVLLAALAALAALAVVGCSSSDSGSPTPESETTTSVAAPTSFTMTLMAKVAADSSQAAPDGCQGGGVWLSGIRAGAYITVTDAAGTVVGAGNLEPGRLNELNECVLFAYPVVELGSAFYNITVANRDPITRPAKEAREEGVGIGYGY